MLSLHTNNAALSAQSSITRTQTSLSTSMTRLSTGYRINSAADDAAGLQIATRLKAQSSGMAVAMRNTQNATSMMQTAEGALGEASNILVRMKDLATQASDASSSGADKTAMQSEYDALAKELSNIVGNTSFGGTKLLTQKASASDIATASAAKANSQATLTAKDAAITTASTGLQAVFDTAKADSDAAPTDTTKANAYATAAENLKNGQADKDAAQLAFDQANAYSTAVAASNTAGSLTGTLNFQIGASSAETMTINLSSDVSALHSALTGVSTNFNAFGAPSASVSGSELTTTASSTIDKLQTAIDAVGSVRSSLGAASNRLDHAYTNLANVSSNTQAAAGRIMDVDFATESSSMTSNQMLLQAGTAMLKQSNSMSSMVMSLLQ